MAPPASLTFADAAKRVPAPRRPTWKNRTHAETWLGAVETYVSPKSGKRPLRTIGIAEVLSVLSPIWDRMDNLLKVHR